jgi:predicted ATP-binding protein involved in virulence
MKLKSLQLSNYRCFESLSIDFEDKLTVLVAENGVGKTAILDAIAVALGPFVGGFDVGVRKDFKHEDARLDFKKGFHFMFEPANALMEAQYPITLMASADIDGNLEKWSRELTGKKTQTTFGQARILIDYAKKLQQLIRAGEQIALPVIAYYGTGRLWKQTKVTTKHSVDSNSKLYGYHDALNSESNYKAFEKWFTDMSIAESRDEIAKFNEHYNHLEAKRLNERAALIHIINNEAKKLNESAAILKRIKHIENVKQTSPVNNIDEHSLEPITSRFTALKHVRHAINQCLSVSGWNTLEYDFEWSELVVRGKNSDSDLDHFMPVTRLSDGVKAMLSLTADIAYRCVQLNPHLASPIEETTGIVLIDEVDLHLHPKWQQTVLDDLRKTFPKIQFIVTTHSPQVISTVPSEQIRIILDGGEVILAEDGTQGAEASRILNEVFGTQSRAQHLDIVKKLNRYLALIDTDQWDTDDALALRKELDDWGRGHEPELIKADIDIRMKEYQRQL